MSLLDPVRVVLLEPQDPVNIAGTVRAMKNMGVRDLRLVRPCAYDPYRLEGIAHGTRDVIDAIRVHASLEDAVGDCVAVAAYIGKPRAAKWPVLAPRAAAERLLGDAQHGPVALVFGREDWGLPNAAIDRATFAVTIPTTAHASLNVAQACLVGLYELHVLAGDATRAAKVPRKDAPPATHEALERCFAAAEQALATIDFLKTRHPPHVMRSVRSLAFRAQPDAREVELVRAMAIEVARAFARQRRELAGAAEGSPADADASSDRESAPPETGLP